MKIKKKILISAGPTVERIDPVRFISNRSSGKMGYAIAKVATANYEVFLVSGPVNISVPCGVNIVQIESAKEMADEIKKLAPLMDIIIMSAAVADYRPKIVSEQKIKKSDDNLILELERTEDIIKTLGENKKSNQILVGFAAETENLLANAQSKLKHKNLDYIIANDVSKNDRGFGSNNNACTVFSRNGEKIELPLMSKEELAEKILNIIELC